MLKNWIQSKITSYHFWLAARVAAETEQQILRSILCSIGIKELEIITAQARKNQEEGPGHCDYTNLAEIIGKLMAERKKEGCRICGCPNHQKVTSP